MERRRTLRTRTPTRSSRLAANATLACAILGASYARGQTKEPEKIDSIASPSSVVARPSISGSVLGMDKDDIVVDLGASKGGADGKVVELWRPLKLRHPVSNKVLVDRFRIGSLKLVQVQRTLALARAEGELARDPEAGDIVVLPGEKAARGTERDPQEPEAATNAATSPNSASAPETAGAGADGAEARELSAMFDALRGRAPAERILRYERYVQGHPKSPYVRILSEEATYLRRLLTQIREPEPMGIKTRPQAILRAPESALAGRKLPLAIEANGASGAVVHVRHAGEMAYRSFPMRGAGPGYFSTTVPAEQMKANEVEYFIESVNASGASAPLVAAAEKPLRIEVHEEPRPEPPPRTDASVALFTDYADYNRLLHNDYAWQTEGYFGLRYRDVGFRAVRSGFGVYRGVGGSLDELDRLRLDGRKVGLTYGYLEGEYAITAIHALIGRIALGLNDGGVNGGGQFFVRLGNDKLTNILLGGEILGGIGIKGVAELQWNTIPRVPIVIRTEVTNQPAGSLPVRAGDGTTFTPEKTLVGGDIGARAMVQVGYRAVPSLTLAVRGSYEGRTIQHAGPGAGLGVTYTW